MSGIRMRQRSPEQNLRYPVLLIHGLFSGSRTWSKTVRAFIEDFDLRFGGEVSSTDAAKSQPAIAGDFYTWNFSSNRNLSYRQQADELAIGVAKIQALNRCTKVILIGHSMGGLAARALLQYRNTGNIFALITLGTPHYGSPFALLRDSTHREARKVFTKMHKSLARAEIQGDEKIGFVRKILLKLLRLITGAETEIDRFFASEAFSELAPGSAALEELNTAPLPEDIRYVFIAGSLTNFTAFDNPESLSRYRKLTRLWVRFTSSTLGTMNNRYLAAEYGIFKSYLIRYVPAADSASAEQLMDIDGAVPVFSQVLSHFQNPPLLRAVLPVFASHNRLTKRPAKIFQALALCGAVGQAEHLD